jgi:DNA-binding FrmR family transcriptional regulator
VKLFRSRKDTDLEQVISELRTQEPDATTLSVSAERVWQRLQTAEGGQAATSAVQHIRGCADIRSLLPAFHQQALSATRALIVRDHLRECVSCRSYASGRGMEGATSVGWQMDPGARGFRWNLVWLSFAAAAVALVIAAVWVGRNWYFAGPAGSRARIDSIEGQAYRVGSGGERALKLGDEIGEGEFIRTAADSHARLRLFEGSEVEMNQRAELGVSASRRDTTIHLDQGSIIVQAAKRHTGHLYVSAPDCAVSVTGTVFSVNSGTKGSRVAVIEGEVHVKHAGAESILHSGDVVATTQAVGVVSVREEIGWSSDLDHELVLLAEFAKLRTKLQEIQTPGPRYESKILPLLPAETVLYIGIPNLGDALQQANRIFQQQVAQSTVLQDWWSRGGRANQHPTPQELIDQIHAISQYLGDEVVITARASSVSDSHGPLLLAEARQPGLKDYLQRHLADTLARGQVTGNLRVVDEESLSSLASDERGMIMLVRPKTLIVGGDAVSVRQMNAQLDSGATLFAGTDFGQRIANVYRRGTETVVAANLGQIVKSVHKQQEASQALRSSGLDDIKYLIARRDESASPGDNRITVEFNGPRHGIASWLAAPAPMGSLEYVSSNAGAAVSFVAKQPALMLDDILSTVGASGPDFKQGLSRTNSELGLDLRNDLASALGGEVTLALDGPVLPTPSWKAVVEVNNSGALQVAMDKLVRTFNLHAQKENQPQLTLHQAQVDGRTFYTIELQIGGLATEYDYTFADGYMIMAPSRALLVAALQTHASGNSLARSASFRALLPTDNQANFSGMIYQNLSPILKPLASQLSSGQLAAVQQLAADAKPSVFCAYGESDRIEVASTGNLFDLSSSLPTLIHLLGLSDHGTSHQTNP